MRKQHRSARARATVADRGRDFEAAGSEDEIGQRVRHNPDRRDREERQALFDQLDEVSLRVQLATDVVKVAAFAAEARRVLDTLDTNLSQEARREVFKQVPAAAQWTLMDVPLSSVLSRAALDLEQSCEQLDGIHGAILKTEGRHA